MYLKYVSLYKFLWIMDYNTQREKLLMPEYGRYVQQMIRHVAAIPDREKRNEQIRAVVAAMGILNPHLREMNDFRQKLWDHVQIISDFGIDIDAPFPVPTRESLQSRPAPVTLPQEPVEVMHYGRNIQNMIRAIGGHEEGEVKLAMVRALAHYMRQQYLIWNKDSVSEELIFRDIERMSGGRIRIPGDLHLDRISDKETFNKPMLLLDTGESKKNARKKNGQNGKNGKNRKRWKNGNNK